MKKIVFIIILLTLIILSGCRTKIISVPVETVRTEYTDRLHKDSVYLLDSVFIKQKNDTVYFEKYKYVYRNKLIRDSIFIHDSIQVPYPVQGDTEYVNRIHWWQQLLMAVGIFGIGMIFHRIYSLFRMKVKQQQRGISLLWRMPLLYYYIQMSNASFA